MIVSYILSSSSLNRIPEGQGEGGSVAAGRLRSLEDQLTRAKQKIHSFQKLSGDGRHGGGLQSRIWHRAWKCMFWKCIAMSISQVRLSFWPNNQHLMAARAVIRGLCVSVPHWAAIRGARKLSGEWESVGMKRKLPVCECPTGTTRAWEQRENNKGHLGREGSGGSVSPLRCRRRKS